MLLALWWLVGCGEPVTEVHDEVERRAGEAEARLRASDGGQLLLQVIDAHGGLRPWLRADSLRFGFDYLPAGKPEGRRHTVNTVHVPTSRARQEVVGSEAVLGFDGQQAWIAPSEDAFVSPARFWALTPYYFVGMPWVLADPGTKHERLPDALLDGQPMERVKVTFDDGVGDAPDDYYVVWADPDDHTMRALTYIVTSSVIFTDGGRSGEKRLTWLDPVQVGGLTFASRYDGVHLDDEGEPAEPASTVRIYDIEVGVPVDDQLFAPPEGAVTGL